MADNPVAPNGGRTRARIGTIAVAVFAAIASFVAVGSIQPTEAAWTNAKLLSATIASVTPAAVPTVTCGAPNGLLSSNIPITWTVPPGPTPSRYRIQWTGGAGSGTTYSTTSPGSINPSGISVAGTSVVTIYPEYGNWITSPASLQTVRFRTIGVIVVVSWTCSPNP